MFLLERYHKHSQVVLVAMGMNGLISFRVSLKSVIGPDDDCQGNLLAWMG